MMGLTGFNPWIIAINQRDSDYLNQQPRVHHVGGRYVDLLCHRLLLRENCCENVTGCFGSLAAVEYTLRQSLLPGVKQPLTREFSHVTILNVCFSQ